MSPIHSLPLVARPVAFCSVNDNKHVRGVSKLNLYALQHTHWDVSLQKQASKQQKTNSEMQSYCTLCSHTVVQYTKSCAHNHKTHKVHMVFNLGLEMRRRVSVSAGEELSAPCQYSSAFSCQENSVVC